MLMIGHLADRREAALLPQKRNPVVGKDLIHAQRIGAHHRIVGNHHRLVAVANVIGKQSPLAMVGRTDDEHRFCKFDDTNDDSIGIENQTVILAENSAARQRGREFKSTV